MMLESAPPARSSSTRQSGRLPQGRLQSRGGIQKRTGTPTRVDRDGDLVMGATTASTRGSGSGTGRGASIRGSATARRHGTPDSLGSRTSSRPSRNGIDPSAIQKAVLRGMGAKDTLQKGPRSLGRSSREIRRTHETRDGFERISVYGLRQSKAASNSDGGVKDLIVFLERKASERSNGPIKIKKSRLEGDAVIISIRPEDVPEIMKLNTFKFAGAVLKIERQVNTDTYRPGSDASTSGSLPQQEDPETVGTIDHLKSVLSRRYNVDSKLLDLSHLGDDPELISLGIFNTTSTESKFFPALMKVCDKIFTSAHDKEEAIISISLANNKLQNIRSVTTLAQTFPALKNLDVSNNHFQNLSALEGWRWKFRKLEQLVITGNPLETNEPKYKVDVLKWYPTLLTLNSEQVRTVQDVKAAATDKLPLPIRGPSFRDEVSIAENFLKQFFPAYDSDRPALANGFYDAQSTFSLSINMSAPRGHESTKIAPWDQYIRRSRNLTKLSNPNAQISRLQTGTESICDCFSSLPATRHPDLLGEPQKWCIECHAIPGLPDPSGQSASGVGGLIVSAHGEFAEIDAATAQPTTTRSFDRTFVLGPGGGPGGIRVVSDILVLRAYGGFDAWKPDDIEAIGDQQQQPQQQQQTVQPTPTQLPIPQQPSSIIVPDGFGHPAPGKSEEQVAKEGLAVELSTATNMTLEYSGMCLEQSAWNLQDAATVFEQAKANLPPEAFINSTHI